MKCEACRRPIYEPGVRVTTVRRWWPPRVLNYHQDCLPGKYRLRVAEHILGIDKPTS